MRAKPNRVDGRAISGVEGNVLSILPKPEGNVIWITAAISNKLCKTELPNADKRERGYAALVTEQEIIGQKESANVDGLRIGIIELEPIRVVVIKSQPLINSCEARFTQGG